MTSSVANQTILDGQKYRNIKYLIAYRLQYLHQPNDITKLLPSSFVMLILQPIFIAFASCPYPE